MKRAIVILAIALTLAAGVSYDANAALANNAILDFNDGILGCRIPGDTYPDCTYNLTTASIAMGQYSIGATLGIKF